MSRTAIDRVLSSDLKTQEFGLNDAISQMNEYREYLYRIGTIAKKRQNEDLEEIAEERDS